MEELNRLLNAGNSPSQMARQLVRYLRNCLMAKLGGEKTELLQISGDERARAVRTATLFSEEDLTRFLQVMLRTFDELNYRQEPRLHLELGLMKLVHLQRLIPLEQILSGLPGAARPAGALGSGRTAQAEARSARRRRRCKRPDRFPSSRQNRRRLLPSSLTASASRAAASRRRWSDALRRSQRRSSEGCRSESRRRLGSRRAGAVAGQTRRRPSLTTRTWIACAMWSPLRSMSRDTTPRPRCWERGAGDWTRMARSRWR